MTTIQHHIKTQRFELQVANHQQAQDMQQWMTEWNANRLEPMLDQICSRFSTARRSMPIERLQVNLGTVSLEVFEERLTHALEKELSHQFSITPDQQASESEEIALLRHFLLTGTLSWRSPVEHADELRMLLDDLHRRASQAFKDFMQQVSQDPVGMQRMVAVFSDDQLFQTFGYLASYDMKPLEKVLSELIKLSNPLKLKLQTLRTVFWQSFGRYVHKTSQVRTLIKQILLEVDGCFGENEQQIFHTLQHNQDHYPALHTWQQDKEATEGVSLWEFPRLLEELQSQVNRHSEISAITTELKNWVQTPAYKSSSQEDRAMVTTAVKELLKLLTPQVFAGEEAKRSEPLALATLTEVSDRSVLSNELHVLRYYLQHGTFPIESDLTLQALPDLFQGLNDQSSHVFRQLIVEISLQKIPMQRMVDLFTDTQLIQTIAQVSKVNESLLSRPLAEFLELGQALDWEAKTLRFEFWQSIGYQIEQTFHSKTVISGVVQAAILAFGDHKQQVLTTIQDDSKRYPILYAWQKDLGQQEISTLCELPAMLHAFRYYLYNGTFPAGSDLTTQALPDLLQRLNAQSSHAIKQLIGEISQQTLPLRRLVDLFSDAQLIKIFTHVSGLIISLSKPLAEFKELGRALSWEAKTLRFVFWQSIGHQIEKALHSNSLISGVFQAAILTFGDHKQEVLASIQGDSKRYPILYAWQKDLEQQEISALCELPAMLHVIRYYLYNGTFPAGADLTAQALPDLLQRLNHQSSHAFKLLVVEISQKKLPMQRMVDLFTDTQLIQTIAQESKVNESLLSRPLAEFLELGQALNWDKETLRFVYWQSIARMVEQTFHSKTVISEVVQAAIVTFGDHQQQVLAIIQGNPHDYPTLHAWQQELGQQKITTLWKLPAMLHSFRYYLQQGTFPVKSDLTAQALPDVFEQLTHRPNQAFRQLMTEISHQKLPLQRLVDLFSDAQLIKTFTHVSGLIISLSKPLAEFKELGRALSWDEKTFRYVCWQSIGCQVEQTSHSKTVLGGVVQAAILAFGDHKQQVLGTIRDDPQRYPMLNAWQQDMEEAQVAAIWEVPTLLRELQSVASHRSELSAPTRELIDWVQMPVFTDTTLEDQQLLTAGLTNLLEVFTSDISEDGPQQKSGWRAGQSPATIAATTHKSKRPNDLDVLMHYLQHGVFPAANQPSKQAFSKILIRLHRHPTKAFKRFIGEIIQQRLAMERMVRAFSDAHLIKVLMPYLKISKSRLSKFLAELKALGPVLNADKTTLRLVFWQSVRNQLVRGYKKEEFTSLVLEEVVWVFSEKWQAVQSQKLNHLPIFRTWAGERSGAELNIPGKLSKVLKDLKELCASLPEGTMPLAGLSQLIEAPYIQSAKPEKRLLFLEALSQIVGTMMSVQSALVTKEVLTLTADMSATTLEGSGPDQKAYDQEVEGAAGPVGAANLERQNEATLLKRTSDQHSFKGRSHQSQDINTQVQKVRSLLAQIPQAKSRSRSSLATAPFDQAEFVGVNNAGLVICWPFLERLFENLELMNNKVFPDQEAAHKAVQVLFYLETGEETSGFEARMVLGKVLCGLGISEPLFPFLLDQEEQEIVDGMLEAVIAKGPLWKNLSLENLRAAYLQREGLLKARDGAWLLQVKHETHDITLEKLPWSFQVIKLPWMSAPLQVEWI